jgi:CRISPR/Cas system-associated protein Cas5 (RAMP superfamily)
MNSYQEQKLIDYKNRLREEADTYLVFSSISENKAERNYELLLSKKIDRIADDIEKIIYGNKIY